MLGGAGRGVEKLSAAREAGAGGSGVGGGAKTSPGKLKSKLHRSECVQMLHVQELEWGNFTRRIKRFPILCGFDRNDKKNVLNKTIGDFYFFCCCLVVYFCGSDSG